MRPTRQWIVGSLLLVAAVLSACGDSLFAPPAGFGIIEGRWNGTLWNGYGYAVVANDSLYLVARRNVNAADIEEVRVTVRFNGVGTYTLAGSQATLGQFIGGGTQHTAPATGQMRLENYDGSFAVGTLSLTAQGPSGPWQFEAGRIDVPVFATFADVPPFPTD